MLLNKEILATIFAIIIIAALTTSITPYLKHFDPWYHYRIAKYTLEQGPRPSFDTLSNMGENIVYPPLLHYLLAIPAHMPGLDLMTVAQVYPLVAGMLAIVFMFLFAREIFGERTALLSALLLSLMPVFKATTTFGYCDHDALDFVFILSAFFFFVKAIKKEESAPPAEPQSFTFKNGGWVETEKEQPRIESPPKNRFMYYALAGVSAGLFALTWLGFPMLLVTLSAFVLLLSFLNPYMRLLDRDMVIGFLILSVVFSGIASLWYGTEITPILSLALFSTAFSYVSLRLEDNRRALPILIGIIIVCSLPILLFFRSWIVDAGLTYIGLRDREVQLEYVAELTAPDFNQIFQNYDVQLLPFVLGLGLFVTSQKDFRRENIFFITSFVIFIFLASSAIRFLQYFGFFVSILAAYFINKISELLSSSLKKDVFLPVLLVLALFMLYIAPQIVQSSISDDWYSSLQWLRNNSNQADVVMNWWDYSPWVNAIAERKTVVNNQPPGRFDDSMVFFGTSDWEKAHDILKKYNVSYVVVSRGTITKIQAAEKFIDEKIDFQSAPTTREGPLYSLRFSNKFKTYFDPNSKVAWDEYAGGKKMYYRKIGLFNDQVYKTQYFEANLTGVDFDNDYLFIFSDVFLRIPAETEKRVFFDLMFTDSDIPYLELVKEEGEVRIYKVK